MVRGSPEEQLAKLLKDWKAVAITWEEDTEPYARKRDVKVTAMCKEQGVDVEVKLGHTLYCHAPPARLRNRDGRS